MKPRFTTAAILLTLALSSAALAQEAAPLGIVAIEPEAAAQKLNQLADRYEAMTDEQVAAEALAEADQLDQQVEGAVKENVVAPDSQGATDVKDTTAATREEAKKPGFRRKTIRVLRKIAAVAGQAVGYPGQAFVLGLVTPMAAGAGFGAGLLVPTVNNQTMNSQNAQTGLVLGAIGGAVGEVQLLGAAALRCLTPFGRGLRQSAAA